MKALTALIIIFFCQLGKAQQRFAISLKAGNYIEDHYISDFNNARFPLEYADEEQKTRLTRTALFILDAEMRVKGIVHLGAGVSYQQSNLHVPYHELPPGSGAKSEALTITLHRSTFALKPTFHYLRWSRIDMYSGLRLGYEFLNFTDNSNDPQFELRERDFIVINFAPQLILLGLNIEIAKGFSLNAEAAYGEPGYVGFGVTYRLP